MKHTLAVMGLAAVGAGSLSVLSYWLLGKLGALDLGDSGTGGGTPSPHKTKKRTSSTGDRDLSEPIAALSHRDPIKRSRARRALFAAQDEVKAAAVPALI